MRPHGHEPIRMIEPLATALNPEHTRTAIQCCPYHGMTPQRTSQPLSKFREPRISRRANVLFDAMRRMEAAQCFILRSWDGGKYNQCNRRDLEPRKGGNPIIPPIGARLDTGSRWFAAHIWRAQPCGHAQTYQAQDKLRPTCLLCANPRRSILGLSSR